MESCHPDRLVIKPQRGDLPLDVVLFDIHGNFIGPVSELSGHSISTRYIVRIEEDTIFRLKRNNLKQGDYVYYYNCDRLHTPREQEELSNELGLLDLKRNNRDLRKKQSKRSRIGRRIMEGVIDNLRDMKIEPNRVEAEQLIEEEIKSTSKNSKSVATIVLKSYYNRNFGSRLEKQKAKKYKKIKARVLGDLCKPKDELIPDPVRNENRMENELLLGKRRSKPQMSKRDSFFNTSTDYSKNSYETDWKGDILLGKKTPSEKQMYFNCMLEEDALFESPRPQMEQEEFITAESMNHQPQPHNLIQN